MKKEVGIYARVSTKDQTVEQQLKELRGYCQRAGYQIAGEYIDEGVSAMKKNRPQFIKLLEDARLKRINLVLVYKLDRFARSLKESISALEKLGNYGVEFVSYSEKDFDTTTAMGKAMFAIAQVFAQLERDLISERTKLKLNYLKANGMRLGRPRKYDVEEIYKLRDEGLSLAQIAQKVGADRSTVCRVLQKGYRNNVVEKV